MRKDLRFVVRGQASAALSTVVVAPLWLSLWGLQRLPSITAIWRTAKGACRVPRMQRHWPVRWISGPRPWTTVVSDAQAFTAGQGNTMPGGVNPATATVTGMTLSSVTLPYKQAVIGIQRHQGDAASDCADVFRQAFGIKSQTISATSQAAAGGGSEPALYNVMIILDTTKSMSTTTDSNCLNSKGVAQTRLQCAQAGALKLLTGLTNAGDKVGLMAFPPQTSSTYNFSCSGKFADHCQQLFGFGC